MTIRIFKSSFVISAIACFMFYFSSTAMAAVIWTTETVDSSGEYNSLALDNIDAPHISYVRQKQS